jgi:acetylornithine deacetylase
MAVPFGTDASTIADAGIPAVVFGPGDIAQAHTNDEWIEIEQMEKAEEILWRLLTNSRMNEPAS